MEVETHELECSYVYGPLKSQFRKDLIIQSVIIQGYAILELLLNQIAINQVNWSFNPGKLWPVWKVKQDKQGLQWTRVNYLKCENDFKQWFPNPVYEAPSTMHVFLMKHIWLLHQRTSRDLGCVWKLKNAASIVLCYRKQPIVTGTCKASGVIHLHLF